eukprot:TRINITY_DN33660_c0_g1_i1.p1 TRINITY_DN33660_c0_g1~~TRINITY_DN33660_c0_g1_i1.p1  ORF type:complete len:849 (+),score=188.36 TRINITY_DN33660_c0_g1_i1:200-2746(+)
MGLPPTVEDLADDEADAALYGLQAPEPDKVILDLLEQVGKHVQSLKQDCVRHCEARIAKLQRDKRQLRAQLKGRASPSLDSRDSNTPENGTAVLWSESGVEAPLPPERKEQDRAPPPGQPPSCGNSTTSVTDMTPSPSVVSGQSGYNVPGSVAVQENGVMVTLHHLDNMPPAITVIQAPPLLVQEATMETSKESSSSKCLETPDHAYRENSRSNDSKASAPSSGMDKTTSQPSSKNKIAVQPITGNLKKEDEGHEEPSGVNDFLSDAFNKAQLVATGKAGMFPDVDAMKDKVREAISKKPYNVHDDYHETGCVQAIAKHSLFEYITLTIIGINSVWIAIEMDGNTAERLVDAEMRWIVGENFFCTYFTLELMIRYCAFKETRLACRNFWFVFDSMLVIFMVMETWVGSVLALVGGPEDPDAEQSGPGGDASSASGSAGVLKLVRMVRLTRMVRLVRLLRAVPELLVLIKGILYAARSVFFTLCLLCFIVYVFAIAFRQLTDDTDVGNEYFYSVTASMSTLLIRMTMPDTADIIFQLSDEGWFFGFLACLFILMAELTVLNMLVGVLCEVVSCVSAVEKEQLQVDYVKTAMVELVEMNGMDPEGLGLLTRTQVEDLLTNPDSARVIEQVGADPIGLVDYVGVMFTDNDFLPISDFVMNVLELRGGKATTVKDMMELRRFLVTQLESASTSTITKFLVQLPPVLQTMIKETVSPNNCPSCSISMSSHSAKCSGCGYKRQFQGLQSGGSGVLGLQSLRSFTPSASTKEAKARALANKAAKEKNLRKRPIRASSATGLLTGKLKGVMGNPLNAARSLRSTTRKEEGSSESDQEPQARMNSVLPSDGTDELLS